MSPNTSPDPAADPAAPAAPDAAAAAAAAAAAQMFTIQLFTLYSVGVFVTILRTYARISTVGLRNLQADDFLVWIAILFYSAQTALGYSVGNIAHGFANNGMTDAQRLALSPNDPEYQMRVIGSKIQLAGWSTYLISMLFLKLSVLVFYIRLTQGLGRRYRLQVWAGFALVIGASLAALGVILFSCSPIWKNWQIYPDPGNRCQPAISTSVIWVSFAASASTDLYLILIPLPMLWGSSLRLIKKIASSFVLGAGIFVLVSATLKTIFVVVDPVNGAQLAGEWGTREAFVAVFTTNLPMIFPLFKNWLKPILGSSIWSKPKHYMPHDDIQTIGGSNSRGKRKSRVTPIIKEFTSTLSASDSREHIVQEIPMQRFDVPDQPGTEHYTPKGAYLSPDVDMGH